MNLFSSFSKFCIFLIKLKDLIYTLNSQKHLLLNFISFYHFHDSVNNIKINYFKKLFSRFYILMILCKTAEFEN